MKTTIQRTQARHIRPASERQTHRSTIKTERGPLSLAGIRAALEAHSNDYLGGVGL
jgi:hypothetical protein